MCLGTQDDQGGPRQQSVEDPGGGGRTMCRCKVKRLLYFLKMRCRRENRFQESLFRKGKKKKKT